MSSLLKTVSRELRLTAKRIDAGGCELTEDEAIDLLKFVAHVPLSKDQAMTLLNLRRSRFDELVAEGKLPKGRKRRGFKELVWYKDELLLIDR